MIAQKICGALLVLASLWFANFMSSAFAGEDCGGALLIFILGIVLLISNRRVIARRDDYE